ncbi:glycosyltransferase [Caulobacter mirabilis]|uniref:Glycosyl transferase n=1 Tax=Caulobacter mirabilis TaxID=69666 RepID=A0A2D2AYM5_9CAUL|nr:glycosyltransferase [Caulobacter mirabilis]ATQ43085.1 glycosyl transferase [Caulobacter mirabilis]
MARILFATWEGGGHVQPMLMVAAGLQARGHDVLVLSDACNAPDADAFTLPFRAWRAAPSRTDKSRDSDLLRDWEATTPLEGIQRLCDRLMIGPAARYAQDVRETLQTFPADLIVSQELLFGVMIAAEAANIPLALFAANIWSLPTLPGVPPFGAGMAAPQSDADIEMQAGLRGVLIQLFDMALPGLNAARAGLGLAALPTLFDQTRVARKILLGASQAFDFAPDALAEPFLYVGPYLSDPIGVADWTSPWSADDPRPLVVVTSSTLYEAQEDILARIIAALKAMDLRAVVTLGPAVDPDDFTGSENVHIVRSAPHGLLFDQAEAVVSHGGHGSVLRPLMAGKPQLVIPAVRDQRDNAIRLVSREAGLMLERSAEPEAIRDAVDQLLKSPRLKASARNLGQSVAADAAGRSAEDAIEALL